MFAALCPAAWLAIPAHCLIQLLLRKGQREVSACMASDVSAAVLMCL